MGQSSAQALHSQTGRLKHTSKTLGRIERSALPGADRLITMVNNADRKNTIILAIVISLCLTALLYSIGVIDMIKAVVN